MEEINRNRRILIVDDEPFNVIGLKILLIQLGYINLEAIIDIAYNGQIAINKVHEGLRNN